MKIVLLFLAALLSFQTILAADEPLVVPSSLKTVTVYRTGAELVHQSTVQLSNGAQDLVIEGISNRIDINSLQINCPSAVTIMGVEFSNNYLVAPEVTARIKILQDSAERLQKDADRTQMQIQTTTDLLEVLKANREIKGQQTGLSVSELVKLMDYYKQKSAELQLELSLQREKMKKIQEALSRIRTQIREEESKNTRHTGQLRLQLSVAAWGKYDFAVSYITPNAWWSPSYDIRVDNIKSPLKVVYKARIAQTTGIDWKKVRLSLSTSVPNQVGNAPLLKAWFLSYINPVVYYERQMATNTIQSYGLAGRAPGLKAEQKDDVKIRGTNSYSAGNAPLYIVNGAPMSPESFARINPSSIKSTQAMDIATATSMFGARASQGAIVVELKEGLDEYISVTDSELNVTFDIELPYDVPTNGKEQTATLQEYAVASTYKYYAVPRLDKDAYLLGEVADWERLNLLPGEANIIFEGTYVGKTFIDPSATTDTLNLTLGRDKRVVVKKEKLVDFCSVKFLGSNKVQKLYYELTVKNNKKDTVKMLLKDQYPLSTLKDIEVELLEDGGATVNPETGVMTWKLEIAPGEARKLRFGYSVKYPRDKSVNLN